MFIHLMKDFPLREYQFIQVSDRKMILRVTDANCHRPALQARIREAYRSYLPADVSIDFEVVNHIEQTASGKFRFVFREMSNQKVAPSV